MDMYIHGKKTGFGASIPLFVFYFSLAQLYHRYKNRLQLGPETRCVGIDMNRYAPNLPLNIFTNNCFYDRNWVGFLIHDLAVPGDLI